jgi:hypothetical protein
VKRIAIPLLAFVVLAVLSYRNAYPSVTLRYRLVLELEIDGQSKFGSGVREVTYTKQPELASQHELSIGYRGEAIAIDLGSRGILFVLLKGNSYDRSEPEWIVLRAFDVEGGSFPRPVEDGIEQVSHLSGKRELPFDVLPKLVRFRDMNDPKTVESVNPFNIAERFGSGTKLVRATLEIVPADVWPFNLMGFGSEPLTTGIEKQLSWLPQYYDRMLDGQRYETISTELRFANSLSSGAFKAGR